MYDYVVMLLFEDICAEKIRYLKDILTNEGIKSREKPWPPHITVDLYKGIKIDDLLEKIDSYAKGLSAFPIYIRGVNDFHDKVLYLEFTGEPQFQEIKDKFDELLSDYRIEENKRDAYIPHATLVINQDIEPARKIMKEHFEPFAGKMIYLAVYDRSLRLLKKYSLV